MADADIERARCTCAEVIGENPDCPEHDYLNWIHAAWLEERLTNFNGDYEGLSQSIGIELGARLKEKTGSYALRSTPSPDAGLREALHWLALRAGELVTATDGCDELKAERSAVLGRLKIAETALSTSPPPLDMGEVATALDSLIRYSRWQVLEGGAHHPTLPSAIGAAEEALAKLKELRP